MADPLPDGLEPDDAMTDVLVRDSAATAAVFGFFASTWFGWAQEHPPPAWRRLLVAGSLASVLTALVGGILTWRYWSAGTVFDTGTGKAFGIIVGVEFVLAAAGAALLAVRGRSELIVAWVALVVGVHLFPVAVVWSTR